MTTFGRRLPEDARSVLLVDWPSVEVPRSLARAGLEVFVKGGPDPEDYTEYVVDGDDVVVRDRGRPPERADVVYSHRPLDELPDIVELAVALGARAVWMEPGGASQRARAVVEAAGLRYVDDVPIVDVA